MVTTDAPQPAKPPQPATPPADKTPLCIFGAGGAFTKELYVGGLCESPAAAVPTRVYVSPAVLHLAAMLARGRATASVADGLGIEARRGLGLLAARIADLDRAIAALLGVIPGNCPAQAYAIVGELLSGSIEAASAAKQEIKPT